VHCCAFTGLNRCAGPAFGSKQEDLENIVTRKIDIQYLERRYLALEREIANALLHGPVVDPADDLRVADLKYRKLIIADEIQQNRRSIQHFDLVN
jgi:hypothetical protein